jgi:nicotinate-nucleotide--dimethylbenzimidazole phosphoribosyltransferase
MNNSNSTIEKTVAQIEAKSAEHASLARARIEKLTMPHWAMGRVLDLATDLSAMTRSLSPRIARKAVFIMAGDHGIVAEGVSLYPKEVTGQMIYNFASGGAAINVLSRQAGARTVVVDVGVDADLSALAKTGQIVNAKIRRGTRNFLKEPAMTREEAIQTILVGIQLAESYAPDIDVFGTGDMGIGNTTPSAAMASVITGTPVESIVGRGTGIADQALAHKTSVIEKALALHTPNPRDGIEVLSKVGGFEIGAIAGLILGAAARKRPVLVDGYISTTGALLAHSICPLAMDYVIPAHSSAENGHPLMWKYLEKKPFLDLQLRLGEGTGAVLAMHLVEASVRILTEMATFESASVSQKLDS